MSEIDNNFPSRYHLGSQVFCHNLNGDFNVIVFPFRFICFGKFNFSIIQWLYYFELFGNSNLFPFLNYIKNGFCLRLLFQASPNPIKKFKLNSHFCSAQSYWKPINSRSLFNSTKSYKKGIIINKMVGLHFNTIYRSF